MNEKKTSMIDPRATATLCEGRPVEALGTAPAMPVHLECGGPRSIWSLTPVAESASPCPVLKYCPVSIPRVGMEGKTETHGT